MSQTAAPASEFSRLIDRRGITADPVEMAATPAECEALAKRLALVAVERMEAVVSLVADGENVAANGTLEAEIVQSCAVTGEDLLVSLREDVALTFVPENDNPAASDEDDPIDLDAGDLDEIPYSGTAFDLGEALAQTLALAIDPYLTGPDADETRRAHGLMEEGAAGPLAEALKGLKGL